MAKGAYSVIAYPEDFPEHFTIETICNHVQEIGGEVAYILHDKDENEDGSLKKAHYHIIMGWESHFPAWRDFVQFQKDNYCSSPEPKEHGRKYYEPTARVRDIHGIVDYLTHA